MQGTTVVETGDEVIITCVELAGQLETVGGQLVTVTSLVVQIVELEYVIETEEGEGEEARVADELAKHVLETLLEELLVELLMDVLVEGLVEGLVMVLVEVLVDVPVEALHEVVVELLLEVLCEALLVVDDDGEEVDEVLAEHTEARSLVGKGVSPRPEPEAGYTVPFLPQAARPLVAPQS